VAIGFQRSFAARLGVAPGAVTLEHVGLNHLTWERAALVDGVDVLPDLLDKHLDELAAEVDLPPTALTALRCVPSYYLRYFYCHDAVVREQRGAQTRGQRVAEIEGELLRMYADPTLDTKPELLSQRGGAFYSEAAVGLIASLHGSGPADAVHSVNIRNDGTLTFLADNAVIEVSCRVDQARPVPLPVGPVTPDISGLITAVSAYEELAVDTALRGGRDRVYRTLLAHPLVGQHEYAEALTDKLLAANAQHLAWAR
jgi:6-phospho-beta-glucosidase